MTLQRLVLDFRNDEVVVRCLYRCQDEAEIAAAVEVAGGGYPQWRAA
jgi:hypothetical protein